jgi:hypothetical protein
MELGETDFARLLVERQKKPIYLPWITMYFKQVSSIFPGKMAL